jgi:hypothetical protein
MPILPNGKEPEMIVEVPVVMVGVWSPAPEFDGKPTQVHLLIDIPDIATFLTRFKSREAVDWFIAELVEKRDEVWGSK